MQIYNYCISPATHSSNSWHQHQTSGVPLISSFPCKKKHSSKFNYPVRHLNHNTTVNLRGTRRSARYTSTHYRVYAETDVLHWLARWVHSAVVDRAEWPEAEAQDAESRTWCRGGGGMGKSGVSGWELRIGFWGGGRGWGIISLPFHLWLQAKTHAYYGIIWLRVWRQCVVVVNVMRVFFYKVIQ